MKLTFAIAMIFAGATATATASTTNTIALPGASANPVVKHQSPQLYGCASDGHSMFADAGAGFGRCKMIIPLVGKSGQAILLARFGYSSPDTSHWMTVQVYSGANGEAELLDEDVAVQSPQAVRREMELAPSELLVSDRSIYAVVEVRGDTKLTDVSYDVLSP